GKCNYFNKAWFEFTGKTPEEEEDYGWSSGMHPDDKDRCMALFISSIKKKIPFYIVYQFLHNDGTYHRVADYASPVHDLNGDFSGYIGSFCDLDKKEEI
ncbi:PAS domain-containing protein, partial [Methanospirillum sp.]|uniref:PAS domain-containing protein n=1 Tax=Methanospirillum sp. TaxID=45200 RepID=UPI001BD67324